MRMNQVSKDLLTCQVKILEEERRSINSVQARNSERLTQIDALLVQYQKDIDAAAIPLRKKV